MWADPILVDLVRQQTDLFNRDAAVEEKMAIKDKIDARKRQLAAENR
ncbi:MAG: hypothetical protein WC428_08460 [Candidatus Paceibacterota bacterium]|jgi:hypothetical protein